MSTDAVIDPNLLTKAQLKAELTLNGIDLPSSDAKKEIYVDLYTKNLLGNPEVADDIKVTKKEKVISRFESFSCDEEDLTLSPEVKKKHKKSLSKMSEPVKDVTDLTDRELMDALKSLGVDVGPIMDSTRRIYQKKLRTMLTKDMNIEGPELNGSTENQFSGDEEEEEMEVEEDLQPTENGFRMTNGTSEEQEESNPIEIIPEPVVTRRTLAPKTSSKTYTTIKTSHERLTADVDQTIPKQVWRAEKSVKSETKKTTTKTETVVSSPGPQQRRGIAIWIQIVLLAIVAIVVFLIISNMEPSYERHAIEN